MGIDIYARWRKQSEAEKKAQYTGFSTVAGNAGYLREAYHGGPYVTHYLLDEAFKSKKGSAKIKAKVLRERLPYAVVLAMHRHAKLYANGKNPENIKFEELASKLKAVFTSMGDSSHKDIVAKIDKRTVDHVNDLIKGGLLPDYAQSFVDFVVLCERKEKELGEPCTIDASY